MKLQEIIRGSVIVAGLGVALLFAGPVRAQQEINPDTFDINPSSPTADVAVVQVSATTAVNHPAAAQASFTPASNWDGSFAAPLNAVDVTMVAILVVGTALVALYTVAAKRRQRRRLSAVRSGNYAQNSGATTN
jgi:hypothetical protein